MHTDHRLARNGSEWRPPPVRQSQRDTRWLSWGGNGARPGSERVSRAVSALDGHLARRPLFDWRATHSTGPRRRRACALAAKNRNAALAGERARRVGWRSERRPAEARRRGARRAPETHPPDPAGWRRAANGRSRSARACVTLTLATPCGGAAVGGGRRAAGMRTS